MKVPKEAEKKQSQKFKRDVSCNSWMWEKRKELNGKEGAKGIRRKEEGTKQERASRK